MVWILLQRNMFNVTADMRDIQGEKLKGTNLLNWNMIIVYASTDSDFNHF